MWKKYSFIVGIIIFILILFKIDLSKLVNILNKINYFYFGLACLMLIFLIIIKSYRWNYLKKKQTINYSFKDSFLMYNTGLFLGILTPGRLGDLSKIFYLKNDNYSLGKSSVSVILDRLSDLLFLIVFGYLGMFLFFSFFQNFIIILTIIFILIPILMFVSLKNKLIQIFLKKIFNSLIPLKYQKSWQLNFQDFIKNLRCYKFKEYFSVFLITLLSWLIYYSQMFFLAKSIGITNISPLYLSISVTITAFVILLPISFLGLGTREATLIFLFSLFNISKELSVSFSLLMLSMTLLGALIGSICWFIKPIHIS